MLKNFLQKVIKFINYESSIYKLLVFFRITFMNIMKNLKYLWLNADLLLFYYPDEIT